MLEILPYAATMHLPPFFCISLTPKRKTRIELACRQLPGERNMDIMFDATVSNVEGSRTCCFCSAVLCRRLLVSSDVEHVHKAEPPTSWAPHPELHQAANILAHHETGKVLLLFTAPRTPCLSRNKDRKRIKQTEHLSRKQNSKPTRLALPPHIATAPSKP